MTVETWRPTKEWDYLHAPEKDYERRVMMVTASSFSSGSFVELNEENMTTEAALQLLDYLIEATETEREIMTSTHPRWSPPPKVEIIYGDLLDGDVARRSHVILHQCNCTMVARPAAGLAEEVFRKYPYSNIYSNSYWGRQPGQIIVSTPSSQAWWKRHENWGPVVVALLGQKRPGGPSTSDSYEQRVAWFREALDHFCDYICDLVILNPNPISMTPFSEKEPCIVSVPARIGCGLARGEWNVYKQEIETLANHCYRRVGKLIKIQIIEKNKERW